MKYLLDTNVLSEPLVARPNPAVIAGLQGHSAELALAAVTWHELRYGMYLLPEGRRRDQIRDYLEQRVRVALPILPFDDHAADWCARERARLKALGRPPAFADAQIAAIAGVNDLILVTRNERDFADFDELQVESWFT